jgi:hypothetical protein
MTNEGEGEALGEGELCHSISTKYWVLSTASGLLLVKVSCAFLSTKYWVLRTASDLLLVKVSCARSMELKDKKVFALSAPLRLVKNSGIFFEYS